MRPGEAHVLRISVSAFTPALAVPQAGAEAASADQAKLAVYREAGIDRVLLEVPDLARDEVLRLLDEKAKLVKG